MSEDRKENPEDSLYMQTRKMLEGLMRVLAEAVFIPKCQLIECKHWSSEELFNSCEMLMGDVWFQKRDRQGVIRFNWCRQMPYGNFRLTFNEIGVFCVTPVRHDELMKATEETWTKLLTELSLEEDNKFITSFPEPNITITRID